MFYMPYISIAVFLVCLFASEYRRTAFILLSAAVINVAIMALYEYMAMQNNPDVVFIMGSIDVLTAYVLVYLGSKHKLKQAFILIGATVLNSVMLMDYYSNLIPVDLYYKVIFILNLIQMLIMRGGIWSGVNVIRDRIIKVSPLRVIIRGFDRITFRGVCNMEKKQGAGK